MRPNQKYINKRLPEIRVNNKASVKELFMSEEDVKALNKSDRVCGPSPGVLPLAMSRHKV